MPAKKHRYYCDYCDSFLTHESRSVRKEHNSGYKHKSNVKAYYLMYSDEGQAALIAEAEGRPPPVAAGGMGGPPPMGGMGGPPPMGGMGGPPPMGGMGGPPPMGGMGGPPPMGGMGGPPPMGGMGYRGPPPPHMGGPPHRGGPPPHAQGGRGPPYNNRY